MIKKANVAGMFYPADVGELEDMISKYLDAADGSGKQDLKAIVAPHAGYVYSGPAASYAYKAIQENWEDIPKTFVVMAPSHHAWFANASVWLYDEFEIPNGNIKVNKKLCEELINNYPECFSFVEEAYAQEHALEVQLPFLQHIAQGEFDIVPLVFWDGDAVKIWDCLQKFAEKNNLFFIVSSDLSHFMPYDTANKVDEISLNNFVNKDLEKIATSSDACGIKPWTALTEIAIKNNWTPKLLKHENSGDTAGDKSKVVGYASLIYS